MSFARSPPANSLTKTGVMYLRGGPHSLGKPHMEDIQQDGLSRVGGGQGPLQRELA